MDPSTFESSHVHTVYNAIASDFSRTRHSRWPFVESFLSSLPPSSLVLDAGTGNGKYLGVRSILSWDGKSEEKDEGTRSGELFNVGFDRSEGLLGIAQGKGHEVVKGDCVDMGCWRRGAFDHAISIATIHHFATPSRRIESIKQMILSILPASPPTSPATSTRRPGQILIVVWSLEQDPSLLGARSARRTTGGKKGAIEIEMDELLEQQRKDQGRSQPIDAPEGEGPREGNEGEVERRGKDVFVPWEKQKEVVPRKKKEPTPRRKHPKKGHPTAPSQETGGEENDSTTKVENGVSNLSITEPAPSSDSTTPQPGPTPESTTPEEEPSLPTFNRYYHLFSHYELSSLIQSAADSLSLEFECPPDYPLGQTTIQADGREQKEEGEGEWRGYVKLKEERWERENWVAEIEVGWRRSRA
ncbi:tRNA (carboxymethyluridine(34)-5-O)-methyltransferase [Sporobolomyces salmoneus]|uniref:tRNA (carboxymethyluridine(34)-5-O)-methyltransferase n=1 Tax=Sporobolomyces salmoneus TaxID=183962 RepID=UPI00316DB320